MVRSIVPMSPDQIRVRLKLLLVAMYRANEGERSNAATAFYNFLIDSNIHPKDIDLLVGIDLIERNQKMIAYLEGELKRSQMENIYFRRHASAQLLRQAATASSVDLARWFALYDALIARLGDPLPVDWQRKAAKILDVTPAVFKRWEVGLVQVPDDSLDKLLTIPPISSSTPENKPKSVKKPRAARRKINPNHLFILQNINDLPGCTVKGLSKHMYGEPDSNEVLADTISTMMDYNWLYRKSIKSSDPNDRSKWLYYISDVGARLLNDTNADCV